LTDKHSLNTLKDELNPHFDDLSSFENKITRALAIKRNASEDVWVETSKKVMDLMFGGVSGYPYGYGIYRGVKVCEFGQIKECEKKMNESMEEKLGMNKPWDFDHVLG